MQLVNLIVGALFIGLLTAHFAKKRGRNPLAWFGISLCLGLIGLIILFLLPKMQQKAPLKKPAKLPLSKRSDAWLKMWYYLDHSHVTQGPYEFPDLIKKWKESNFSEGSYVWGEGMKEWSRLSELPELLEEIEQA